MKPNTLLDYALFELSPKHSRCDLFLSSNGETEKLASGFIQPFVNHLRILQSQAALTTHSSIRLQVEKTESWFTTTTLERFVEFVNSQQVLEKVNTFDSEMSQLEAAKILYSQDDGGVRDETKKELLRAIDLRLEAIKKDLTTSIDHASANGFDPHTVSDLQHFADRFGAHHLDEACSKYISLCQRRPDLITKDLNTSVDETNMSQHQSSTNNNKDEEDKKDEFKTSHHTRRLSVQDRINLFESKQKENKPVFAAKTTELRRLSSDVSSAEKSVLRRWSTVSDMSFDLTSDNNKFDTSSTEEGPLSTTLPMESEEKDDNVASPKPAPAGSLQTQISFGVNADSAGKTNDNRVCATPVDQMQSSRESPQRVIDELQMKANDLQRIFAEHKQKDQSAGDGKNNGNDLMRRNLSFSEDCKGKLFDKYMKKRDAKLREEWSSKESKLKSMQEALERSRNEMKAKFSEKRQDPISNTRQRAEKFTSLSSRSSTKKYQHPISSLQIEEDDEKDKPISVKSIASRSSQVRKVPSPNRSSRVSKPSAKVSNSNITSGRGRRTTQGNPVAQSSVPTCSDLKKENTKPSSLAVRNATTTMMRTHATSSNKKTTKEDIPSPVKPRRPRSLKKSFSANIEFTELPTLYSDDTMNKERNQKQNTDIDDHVQEKLKNEEFDEIESEKEEEAVESPVKEEEETLVVEDIGDENPSPLCEKVENSSEDENFTSLRSISQVDLPVITTQPSSTLKHNLASLMDSPNDSPLSWNSNLQHAFSYPHEHSDADASVDYSPMGSPASWSSRMRKKWGTTAQSPVLVSNSSSPLRSRKDLAKGIKRLLNFGKKTRATDSLMDWGSVTTSEGDDDFSYRSSDELRKTRMASSQIQVYEDEQASNNGDHHQGSFKVKDGEFKRSIFSLSTFRSKRNDSKPR